MTALVTLRNVTKSYVRGKQKVEVLHGVDLNIEAGEFLALMGPRVRARPHCSTWSRGSISPPAAKSRSLAIASINCLAATCRTGARVTLVSFSSSTTCYRC